MMTYDNYDRRVDKILEKADAEKKRRKKRRIALISSLSAAAAFLLALNLTLFVPYTVGGYDISAYAGSEYYALMDEIGSLNCSKPRKTNNLEKLAEVVLAPLLGGGFAAAPDMAGDSPSGGTIVEEDPSTSGNQSYEEVTNNQVQGVVEGDLLKRSDKYLYYLSYAPSHDHQGDVLVDENGEPIPDENGDKQVLPAYTDPSKLILNIYTVSGEKVNTYAISDEDPYAYNSYGLRREMYLTEDCTKILILVPYFDKDVKTLFTRILGIDVSDPSSPREFARTSVSGDYVSSRLVGNTLLLVSNFTVRRDPDFAQQRQYLPAVDGEILPMEDIVLPENPTKARYTVIASFAADTLSTNDCEAYFDFSEEVYVSAENIYTTRSYRKAFEFEYEVPNGPTKYYRDMTEIARTSYDGTSLTYRGEMSAFGTIVDQYSLDEHEGVLRIVTTEMDLSWPTCRLYCFDVSTFEQIAAVENFAPEGESVKSVRFDGDTAYVCTAKVTYYEVTDPVFEFDLSDYDHITYKDTGTIPGYSLSLIKFFDDTLLGIGYGDGFDELKIEVYASDEDKVTPLCEFKLFARFSTEFKAYFIDAENGLVGLQVDADSTHKSGYLVLRFDGYNLVELMTVEDVGADPDAARACLIGDTFYIFGYTTTGDCVLKMVEV